MSFTSFGYLESFKNILYLTITPFEVFRYIFWWIIPLIESLSSPVAVFSIIFTGSNFSPSFFAISYCIKEFAALVSTKLLISSFLLFSLQLYRNTTIVFYQALQALICPHPACEWLRSLALRITSPKG